MSEYNEQEDKSFAQKAAIPALLIALLLALFYYKDSVIGLFGGPQSESLAEVTAFRNDVRRKDSKSIDFKSTQKKEQIYHGDSLSTGTSSTALVTFKSGQILNVDQNSLIIFDELTDTPEFVRGNVKVTVKGKMKLKIDNEIVEIDGHQSSDVQIYKDEKAKAQKIVLLKGTAQIKNVAKKEIVSLQKNIPVEPKRVILAADQIQNTRQPSQAHPSKPVVLAPPPVAASGHYKLYDYYSRMLSSNTELARNRGFSVKPNFSFQAFTPATIQISPQAAGDDPSKNPYTVRIEDPVSSPGYVIEVSSSESFPEGQTQYSWKNSYFTQNFTAPGIYYLRYRKVMSGQILTDYSPTERLFVPEKPKPAVIQKPDPEPEKKTEPKKQTIVFKEKPVERKQIVVEKKKPIEVERKPAAVPPEKPVEPQAMQSNVKTSPEEILRNQNYHLTNIGIATGQAYMVSGQQLANSNQINSSYSLNVNGTYWKNQNGVYGSYSKALLSQNSTNLVTQTELAYIRRFTQLSNIANGGTFQLYASLGLELYQNSQATSDFVDSYNLYKLGVGASMPIFNFWSIDGNIGYGTGDSKKSSIFFGTRANYFFSKKLSLGIGWKARKFDYYLIDQRNYESLSETYAILNMYY